MRAIHKKKSCRSKLLIVAAVVALLCIGGATALGLSARSRAQRQSLYLTMRDGTRIAVDVWLPAGLESEQQLPAMLRATRYWRSYQLGPLGRALEALGALPEDAKEPWRWTTAGYALVVVDGRGSGASFGRRPIEISDDEVADLANVIDWIVAQPWSNGRVGAYGVSYDGNMAEMAATLDHPALKAVAPQYADFDLYGGLFFPGGVFNRWFSRQWDGFVERLDADDPCAFTAAAQVDCNQMKTVFTGVRRVDEDPDGTTLAAALAERDNAHLFSNMQTLEYRDDVWGTTEETLGSISPYGSQAAIERSGVAMSVWVSWLDSATAEGAISRYLTFYNAQQLIIGPWSHGGSFHADPFLPPDTPTDPAPEEQFQMLAAFFDAHLKDGAAAPSGRGVTYYTLGEGTWRTSPTWPPAGFERQRWYFGPHGSLSPHAPGSEAGADQYVVDWTATTGEATRWHTGLYKTDVVYPDRALEDGKLLTYTSAPMETDVEITGSPIVTLYVASSESEGAFHVYLEDVAPDGRVTYITEGLLRAIHRRVSDREPPYRVAGPYHSFERADAAPLVPGEVAELRLSLYATSVLIRQGHRVRVALAGHDASVFARYPAQGTPLLAVQRSSVYPSSIELPLRVR